MQLEAVVPWGRSFQEYKDMFLLTENDLKKNILGCGDGPASFNYELTTKGGNVISVDPTYCFNSKQFQARIAEVYKEVMPQMYRNKEKYIWKSISSVEELGRIRMLAMNSFLADFESGKNERRYIEGSLPNLEFHRRQFDLTLCSHYLFLYSEQVNLEEHIASLKELCRVSKEVRIYPLLALNGQVSPHLNKAMAEIEKLNFSALLKDVRYQFQKGANQMLVLKSV